MKIELPEPRPTFEEWVEKHNLTVEVVDRDHLPEDDPNRYYAHFPECEEKDGNILAGTFGDGATPEEAIRDYAKQVGGKHLVFHAWDAEKRYYLFPPIFAS